MKKLKLFFALFAMLALNVGNAWAETITLDNLGAGLTSTSNEELSTTVVGNYTLNYLQGKKQNNAILLAKGTDGGTSFISNKTPIPGAIQSVTVHINSGASGKTTYHCAFSTTECTSKYVTGSTAVNITGGKSNKYTCSVENASYFCVSLGNNNNGQVLKLVIEYTPSSSGGGGSTETAVSLTANPTTIDFGTVYEGATVESKTVTVNFENLTGDVTYSGLSTPFSATGNISTTGDQITISADASTIGEYSQTLTLASTADSKTAEVTVKMNVVEKPAPTGTFTLHTGELIEGDYVIYYSGKAMKSLLDTKSRLQYEEVTPTDNKIVDPLVATIWHIAPSGTNWTVYNENVSKYAAGTGTKSEADLVADLTGDNANKAAWTVTASGNAYEFVNVWNESKSVNANLRNNGTYGFACYATSTGGALSLYRKAGTKYNVTVSSTTNGSVTADPTSAEAGATIALTVTPDAGYVLDALTVTDASSNTIEVADNRFTMPAANVTIAATFKANEKPDATLTLSKNGNAETFPGSWKQDDVVTLPSITSDCVKAFVGWSANPTCNEAPEYKAGDEYPLAETAQTLYAVYADVVEGGVVTIKHNVPSTGTITNMTGNNDAEKFFGLDVNDWSIVSAKNGASNHIGVNRDGTLRLYYHTNGGSTLTITAPKDIASIVLNCNSSYNNAWVKVNDSPVTPVDGVYSINAKTVVIGNANTENKQVYVQSIEVTLAGELSNYSTTCVPAPKAEVNLTEITATAAGANGNVEVTYEHVNTESVTVALFNNEACTEAFSADWLTASLDGDKNVTYTIAENTTYAERKAYVKLTAPETTGATEPAVVVIPVIQAGKDKVFASLEALLAAITPTTEGVEVTVTLTNEVIKDFNTSGSSKNGIALNVPYQGGVNGVKEIEIYCNNVPADWVKGGKVSGTITCPWKDYYGTWELCPTTWEGLTYTAPATVKSIAVSGTPTKTTYIDGEAFDPTGLVVTATLTDDSTEPIVFALVDWTFDPATLSTGQISVNVTATYNSVSSVAYEVTGLTVNDIPTKTVAEFIAAKGGRCYLEGIVSNISNTTYGNFDLTDESGTIYVYGCLNANGESKKFAELGVKNGDKIKVVADEYELYQSTKPEAKNVQYVSHISAATITIADITMEKDEVKNISATVEPAEAEVTYTIKKNAENAISLSGNTITALAVGTAIITATVENGATYMGNSVDFTVTVGPKTEKTDVVILAEHNGQWYALMAKDLNNDKKVLAALAVTYYNGILYNVNESDKGSITWTRAVVGDQVTFKNGTNYLYVANPSKTELSLNATAFSWTYDAVLDTYTSNNGARTFLYSSEVNGFKNFAINNNVGTKNYSGYPVVTAPDYHTAIEIGSGDNRTVIAENEGRTVNVIVDRAFEAGDEWYTLCVPFDMQASLIGTAYQLSGLLQKGTDYVEVNLAPKNTIEAGQPYLVKPNVTVNKFVVENVTIVNTTGGSIEQSISGLSVAMQGVINGDGSTTDGLYWVGNNGYLYNDDVAKSGLRTYFSITTTTPSGIAPRMRVVAGENVETGVEDLFTTDAPVKVIENGQLIIIREGVKYNVQGQKL